MIHIAICDDQPQDLRLICQYLKKYQQLHPGYDFHTDIFCSGEELLHTLNQQKAFDIYLLDIIMPGVSGIQLAQKIRQSNTGGVIIFLTSSPEYSLEAFGVKAMQYLLKPVDAEMFFSVMDDAANILHNIYAKTILVSLPDGKQKIHLSSIAYVECKDRVLFIHLNTGEVLKSRNIRQSFEAEMSLLLEDCRFCRPHQSYIINMNYASRLLPAEIIMQDSSLIPISKKRVKEVRKEYLDYLSGQALEL